MTSLETQTDIFSCHSGITYPSLLSFCRFVRRLFSLMSLNPRLDFLGFPFSDLRFRSPAVSPGDCIRLCFAGDAGTHQERE